MAEAVSSSGTIAASAHHTVRWSTTLGEAHMKHETTRIGNGVYIGPGAIVSNGRQCR
jgi:hypothetical protein